MESLFSKERQGDKKYCKSCHTLFISVGESYCPRGPVWCLHKLNITPAALGISTLRVSEAEAEAMVSSSLKLKALSLYEEISLPNLAHISAARANYVLALLRSD